VADRSGVHAPQPGAGVTGFRDFLAQWLLCLIALTAFAVGGMALFWIGARFGEGRAGRRRMVRLSADEVETQPIPRQRQSV
jgi:membrane protein DedA with SNARE-associated domain